MGLIAIDVDNTVCHTSRHFLVLTARQQGLSGPEEDPEHYEFERQLLAFPDQARAREELLRLHGGHDLGALRSCPPDDAARQALQALSGERYAGRPVLGGYLTRRRAALRGATAEWLAEQGFPALPVYCTEDHSSGHKSAVMAAYGFTALIDDAPHEAYEVSVTARVALRRRAYNRGVRGPGIVPFEDWAAFPLAELLG